MKLLEFLCEQFVYASLHIVVALYTTYIKFHFRFSIWHYTYTMFFTMFCHMRYYEHIQLRERTCTCCVWICWFSDTTQYAQDTTYRMYGYVQHSTLDINRICKY
jgi:hypothetical protein